MGSVNPAACEKHVCTELSKNTSSSSHCTAAFCSHNYRQPNAGDEETKEVRLELVAVALAADMPTQSIVCYSQVCGRKCADPGGTKAPSTTKGLEGALEGGCIHDKPATTHPSPHFTYSLQSVALELRAKGVKYSPHKHGNKKPTSSKKKKAASKTDTDAGTDRPHKPRRAPQVIVIPIYWNTKQQEKEAVIAAARRCVDGIAQAGIKVGLDTTNTHTPGSKFRYWEERGCKYRVELGPQDVHNVTAVLAICGMART